MSSRQVKHPGDEELVRRAKEGDQSAFEALVRNHQDEVFTLAMRLVSKPELAADVSQEAFIRAWRALPKFRGDAQFGTWLYRIVVNTAWTLRKRSQRHQAAPIDEGALNVRDTGISPEQWGEGALLRVSLQRELDQLGPGQRAVVVMKDVYGYSHDEVAEALGISVTAAKVRLHRARKRLRDGLFMEAS
ncbi:MAG: sigma-70 family RNA polymerase sigma factor [Acidimicrobiia bacterium]|nr:sigma-70 family RNA polymerase sigma factor [Acidimicrobiia bacterium]MDH3471960.1 sigma-70 family RNA polymerase sigma factor [Acidimicrobiia bacterium]